MLFIHRVQLVNLRGMVEHKNVARLVCNNGYLDLKDMNTLNDIALTFDPSIQNIWGTLLNGGTLFLADNDVITNPFRLEQWIQHYSIDYMAIPVALFNQLVTINPNIFIDLPV